MWRYSLATLAAVLALAIVRALFGPLGGVYYATPIAVIALLALSVGAGPGIFGTSLTMLGLAELLRSAAFVPGLSREELLQLFVFFTSGLIVSVAAGKQREGRARYAAERAVARRAAQEAERAAAAARESLEALRESEERFRQLADSMPQIVWASRPDGTLDYFNRKWYELTGAAEGQSGDESWLPILHPDDRQKCLDLWYESVRTGKPYQIEYRFKFPNRGEYRWHLGRALPVRDEAGNIVRWYGTSTDIHDAKEVEAALRETEQRQRTLVEALREASLRKDEFLAMLSHELRNPLAPVRNSIYILDHAPCGSEQERRAKRVIDRQIGHMVRLVDDLLDITRISRGKIQLQRESIELVELVRRTVDDHRSVFERSEVALELQLCKGPVWVDGDATRLSQVVGNLLQNAAKFSGPGGHTRVSVDVASANALVRVRDDGMGIAPEILPRLFDPFTQAESTLDRSRGGLGLGLALVKGLVELHGGNVQAASAGPGQGAEFTIRLPIARSPRRAEPLPGRSAPPHARRVLVIEDNTDAAESLKEALELRDHDVEIAHSGPDGLDKARAFLPDVVVCDIGLPGMDGYEVARAIRAEPALRSTRLVALTGYASPDDRRRASDAGFDRHLAKPPDLMALERMLHERELTASRKS